MNALPKRKRSRKAKREPSPTCFDPSQLDLVEFIEGKTKREAFAKLDQAIERTLRESGQ
jgi:hypothetical protein